MAAPPLSAGKRVVVLWIGRLGDVLVSTPFLDGLRAAAPRARLVLVTAEAGEGGARLVDGIDEVLVVRKGRRLLENLALVRSLRKRADLLVDLNSAPSGTSRTLARLAKARVKAAFRRGRGDRAFGLLADPAGEKEHMLDRYARLAALLGFAPGSRMRVHVPVADQEEAIEAMSGLHRERRPVALFPGNFKKSENRWPEERFAALADRLAARPGLAPFWLSGPGEREKVEAAAAMARTPLPVLGPFPLGVTAAVLERSALYVGNCTGVSHLAACVGTPSFMVLAGYTAAVWAPRGGAHWSSVSRDWESCRDVSVEDAWEALQPALTAGD